MFMFIKENLANIAALLIMLMYLLVIANIGVFQEHRPGHRLGNFLIALD